MRLTVSSNLVTWLYNWNWLIEIARWRKLGFAELS